MLREKSSVFLKKQTVASRYSEESLRLFEVTFEVTSDPLWSFLYLAVVCDCLRDFTSVSRWITALTLIGADTAQNHCSEYNYVDDLCVRRKKPTRVWNTHTDPHAKNTSTYTWYNTWGRCGQAQRITLWQFIHESSGGLAPPVTAQKLPRRYLPPGSGDEDLQQMDGAETGGIWFIGWVSICGLRI